MLRSGLVKHNNTYLSGIGIPHFDIVIKGRRDEQPGVHRIPDGLGDGELVAMLMLPVHEQNAPVLGDEPGLVLRRVLQIEDGGRPVRRPREQVPPLCQINLAILSNYERQQRRLTHRTEVRPR